LLFGVVAVVFEGFTNLDFSIRCIQVIAGVLGRAGEEGQKKRLEAAKSGEITWLPPPGLGSPVNEEEEKRKTDLAAAQAKKAKAAEMELEREHTRGTRSKFGDIGEDDL
jgi:small subunit ribosomal protein S2